jgi:hypothetical protein
MIPRMSGRDRRGAHVRMCAHPPPPLPSTRTTALALFRLLNILIPLQRRPIWITPTDGYVHDYIKQLFLSIPLSRYNVWRERRI